MIKCGKCKLEKEESEFSTFQLKRDGLYKMCKLCKAECDARTYIKNREKRKMSMHQKYLKDKSQRQLQYQIDKQCPEFKRKEQERSKIYRLKNKEILKQKKKEYYNKNKKKIFKQFKEKRWNDLGFRLKNNMRSRMYHALKGGHRNSSILDYIGCDMDSLKEYLSKQFTIDMTWDNYGKFWQIDHIIPCYKFDLTKEEQMKKCFHYTNLQPLKSIDNMIKNRF